MPTSAKSLTARARGILVAAPEMDAHGLGDLLADGIDRVEARHRLLEDHGDVVAADLPQALSIEFGKVECLARLSSKPNAAVGHPPDPLWKKAHDREAGDGFA